ncbi:MAG: type III secretion system cytoplasmic ring protein SctQ [Deltaproteobacteria bacterium]|nr:type III secretion system cytoplasmic ring protein SctQ [Deltaproteobacteria bacterium]
MTEVTEWPDFAPEPLSPLLAQIGNVLFTRKHPWQMPIGAYTGLLAPVARGAEFTPAFTLGLEWNRAIWNLEIGNPLVLFLHPALSTVSTETVLPEELQQALLELLLTPLLTDLEALLGGRIILTKPSEAAPLCHIALEWRSDSINVPLRIGIPGAAPALTLLEKLRGLPIAVAAPDEIPMEIGVEAGRMRIAFGELAGLAVGDVLLPDVYPAVQGWLTLNLASINNAFQLRCELLGTTLKIAGFVASSQEEFMTETAQEVLSQDTAETVENAPVVPGVPPDVNQLEATLTFELERRLMTVREIGELVPGYTFALGCDGTAPVTLRVNGKALGTGRLVDMNGVLGVQITTWRQ